MTFPRAHLAAALTMAVATAAASSVSASTLTFGSSSDEPTKIFVLSSGSSDAILIESGGWYGIIDGGEDANLPDGSDPRYPVRSGTAVAEKSTTDWLMGYLDDQGSTTLTSLSTWARTPTLTTSTTRTRSFGSSTRRSFSAPSTPTSGSRTSPACGTTSGSTTT